MSVSISDTLLSGSRCCTLYTVTRTESVTGISLYFYSFHLRLL
jgi:hypothetical protein